MLTQLEANQSTMIPEQQPDNPQPTTYLCLNPNCPSPTLMSFPI